METATWNSGLCHRSPTARTIENNIAATSVLGFRRHAAREVIDDRGLRLMVTVEPVVRNHSSREDDADPQNQRKRAGNSRGHWWSGITIPGRNTPIDVGVKDPDIHTGQGEHHHFDPEKNILI